MGYHQLSISGGSNKWGQGTAGNPIQVGIQMTNPANNLSVFIYLEYYLGGETYNECFIKPIGGMNEWVGS
jgi:hypothetical protein